MFTVVPTSKELLHKVAACHMACFPGSLSTKLGASYVRKSLEWFLVDENRFLFQIEQDGVVAGYCGGFIPRKIGDGSSSGMLQHAFSEAIKGIIKKPWLVLHNEVVQYYPFIWRNIKRKMTGKVQPAPTNGPQKEFKPFVGLVVIGVHPQHRGSGVAQHLMAEFERQVKAYKQTELYLSVKKDNGRAIKAYQNFGWKIDEDKKDTYLMKKVLL
ncbi:GNAT family N-acetyltransferase [Aridibaculum aurantiacum]|uniref:GNAT family N-acetyltransferase n=1 Tax=Aridibaculum aurantiacum TaxID=2810307 RepID=UPI001A97566D|nr:GNAT family N-acetyltransferase [Aridibaculum aurantiacum]